MSTRLSAAKLQRIRVLNEEYTAVERSLRAEPSVFLTADLQPPQHREKCEREETDKLGKEGEEVKSAGKMEKLLIHSSSLLEDTRYRVVNAFSRQVDDFCLW